VSIKDNLENNMRDAMRKKDELTRDTLRILLSSIKLAEIEAGKILEDASVLAIIQKEVKIRKETMNELVNSGRLDLIEKAQKEYEILIKYLPVQLEDGDIENYAREAIVQISANNMSDMGKVMGILVPRLSGQASPDRISQVVKRLLSKQ